MNSLKNMFSRRTLKLAAAGGALALVGTSAFAGATSGPEFQALYDMLVGWAEGYLGMALAVAAFITGAAIGFAKSTAMPALVGVVFAIVFSIGPGIITGMFGAVI